MEGYKDILKSAAIEIMRHLNNDNNSPIEIKILQCGVMVKFKIKNPDGSTSYSTFPQELTGQQKTVLSVFSPNQSFSVEKIARLSGYTNNSHLRACLADLVKAGFLLKDDAGYRLSPDKRPDN